MRGREFLELAGELLTFGGLPRHWRATIIHAYYALFLECRDTMIRWGLPLLTRYQVHTGVRNRLVFATDPDVKQIGFTVDKLGTRRNAASYDLRPLQFFATVTAAQEAVKKATDALVLLDAIDADSARRAAAVASIRP